MSNDFDPTLLAQRIDQLERENDTLRKKVEENTAATNKAEGRSGIMSAALPLLIGIGCVVFGSVIYSGLQESASGTAENQTALATIDERLKMNESQIQTMLIEDKQSREDRTRLSGLVERSMLLISQNTKSMDANSEKAATNQRAISSMASSVEGHLREVETQIRSVNEVYNVRWQGMRSLLAIIYRKAFDGESLPEEDYYPQNIPASATNELGKIQTNGK